MSLSKLLALTSLILFGIIGIIALLKEPANPSPIVSVPVPLEVELDQEIQTVMPAASVTTTVSDEPRAAEASIELPEANRIEEFFAIEGQKLPIVETITYKSRVPWQKGRPAWLSDYASHYETSRHFIARSLNGKSDYFKQDLSEGAKFNVLRQDKNFEFALIVDTCRCKMWFYYIDLDDEAESVVEDLFGGTWTLRGIKNFWSFNPLR